MPRALMIMKQSCFTVYSKIPMLSLFRSVLSSCADNRECKSAHSSTMARGATVTPRRGVHFPLGTHKMPLVQSRCLSRGRWNGIPIAYGDGWGSWRNGKVKRKEPPVGKGEVWRNGNKKEGIFDTGVVKWCVSAPYGV